MDLLRLEGGSLAALLEACPDATVICTGDGRIVHANTAVAELTGYEPAELLALHVESLVPPEQRSRHERHRSSFVDGAESRRPMGADLDIQLLRKDGVIVPVDIALSKVEIGGSIVVLASIRDATEHRRADRALQRQAMLLELATDAIFVRGADDWAISYWNQAAVDLYGFSRGEAIGRPSRELLQTEFPSSFAEVDAALAASGRWDGELTQTRRDGTAVAVTSRHVLLPAEPGEPAGVLEINRDVTLLKRANEQLAVIADRERLSRELSDHLVHSIFGVGLSLQAAASLVTDDPVQARIAGSIEALDEVVRELRRFIFDLAGSDGTGPAESLESPRMR